MLKTSKNLNWPTILFLSLTPIGTLVLLPIYWSLFSFPSYSILIFSLAYGAVLTITVTAGYHRLFAHRSYEANRLLRFFYIFFGAGAFQGSVLDWCSDHRRHHRDVDTSEDPYNIKQGFMFAHIGWMLVKQDAKYVGLFPSDLESDPVIRWQHRNFYWLSFVIGFGVPTFVGYLLGDVFGGFLFGGLLRVVFSQHSTFFINSLCHTLGKRPYNDRVSARDSLLMAFFTHGEGYHNYHHHFPWDYRNGIRWFDWDPTKWWISFCQFIGFTKKLKRVPRFEVFRAKFQLDEKLLISRGIAMEKLEVFHKKIELVHQKFKKLGEEYARIKADIQLRSKNSLLQFRTEQKLLKIELKAAVLEWGVYRRALLKGL